MKVGRNDYVGLKLIFKLVSFVSHSADLTSHTMLHYLPHLAFVDALCLLFSELYTHYMCMCYTILDSLDEFLRDVTGRHPKRYFFGEENIVLMAQHSGVELGEI